MNKGRAEEKGIRVSLIVLSDLPAEVSNKCYIEMETSNDEYYAIYLFYIYWTSHA